MHLTEREELLNEPTIGLTCPHCGVYSKIYRLSEPIYNVILNYSLSNVGIVYMCEKCTEPIFLKFKIKDFDTSNNIFYFDSEYIEIEHPRESFEFKYLPKDVENDFKEALDCMSIKAYNGFAALCRRILQSSATNLGVSGKNKVQNQINNLIEELQLDKDTSEIIHQVMLDGHDGAHPHLPRVTMERAEVLLFLIKDVLNQLFVRRGKLEEAKKLRSSKIEKNKE